MFEFKNGDPNFLRGNCLVYSTLEKSVRANSRDGIIGVFECISHDLEEFKKNADPPKELLENMLEQIKKIREENPCLKDTVQMYSISGTMTSEERILETDLDVVCMGHSHFINNCGALAGCGAGVYSLKYREQLLFRNNYTKYAGRSIRDHIMSRFIDPLLAAYDKHDAEEMHIIYTKLDAFSHNSHFGKDIDLLKGVFNSGGGLPMNKQLLGLVLNKINAIHLEKYEDAAKLNTLINEFLTRRQVKPVSSKRL